MVLATVCPPTGQYPVDTTPRKHFQQGMYGCDNHEWIFYAEERRDETMTTIELPDGQATAQGLTLEAWLQKLASIETRLASRVQTHLRPGRARESGRLECPVVE